LPTLSRKDQGAGEFEPGARDTQVFGRACSNPYNAFRKAFAGPFSGVWGHSGKAMSEFARRAAKANGARHPRNVLDRDRFTSASSLNVDVFNLVPGVSQSSGGAFDVAGRTADVRRLMKD
jgi:hypothetical protein